MKCPKCDSSSVAEILWGYFAVSKSIEKGLDSAEFVMGGCLVSDHDPKWECNDCNHRWGEREE